jgi:hypothetical protein
MMQNYNGFLAVAIHCVTSLPWSECIFFAKQIERHKQLESLPVPPRVRAYPPVWEEMNQRYRSVNG